MSKGFDALGGTIGRTPDNDLVLQDPSKSISRKHARIDYRSGVYYLIATGSNPSKINGVVLDAGSETRLVHGDCITIGDYVLEVDCDLEPERPFGLA